VAARTIQNNRSSGQANTPADHIPLIRSDFLDNPKPHQRRKNIDPAIGSIATAGGRRVDARKSEREEYKREDTRNGPRRTFAEA
jgi:hypothetical protein